MIPPNTNRPLHQLCSPPLQAHIPFGACGSQFPSRLREGLGVGQSDEIDGFAPNADSPTPNPSRKREGRRKGSSEYAIALPLL